MEIKQTCNQKETKGKESLWSPACQAPPRAVCPALLTFITHSSDAYHARSQRLSIPQETTPRGHHHHHRKGIPRIQFAPEHSQMHISSTSQATTHGNWLAPPHPAPHQLIKSLNRSSSLPFMFCTPIFQFSPQDAPCCAFCTTPNAQLTNRRACLCTA